MEAVYLPSSTDLENHRKLSNRHFVPHKPFAAASSSSSFSSFNGGSTGLFYTPQSSISNSSFRPSSVPHPRHHHHQRQHQNLQPPLLPLPIPKSNHINNKSIQHRSLSIRKSKADSIASIHGKEKSKHRSSAMKSISSDSVMLRRLRPDPKDIPRVLLSSSSNSTSDDDQVAKFSGSIATSVLSPPPSSLPLPTFSIRPKVSCNAQAATGIDAGATDNLRRILRIR